MMAYEGGDLVGEWDLAGVSAFAVDGEAVAGGVGDKVVCVDLSDLGASESGFAGHAEDESGAGVGPGQSGGVDGLRCGAGWWYGAFD